MSKPSIVNCKGCGSQPNFALTGARVRVQCPKDNCWVGPAEPTQKAAAFKWNMAMRRVR